MYFGDFDVDIAGFYRGLFVEYSLYVSYESNAGLLSFTVYYKLSVFLIPMNPLVTLPNFFILLLFFLSDEVALDNDL